MIWQSWSTIDTFISFRTTLAISKETSKSLPPPTLVVCQEHKWRNGHFEFLFKGEYKTNVSDEDWVLKQFFRLNDKMYIQFNLIPVHHKFTIGDNYFSINDKESMTLIVKEVLNPWNGLCYAIIIPQSNITAMGKDGFYVFNIGFSHEIKNPSLSVYLISPENWYGMMLANFGNMKPFKISLTELHTFSGIYIQQRKYFHMQETWYLPPSMTTCRNYSKEDSYMKCRVKNHIHNFERLAVSTSSGCTCIPSSTYKSFFEIQPTSLEWEECKTNSEYEKCTTIMDLHMDQDYVASKCPTPCEKVNYIGEVSRFNGGYDLFGTNEIALQILFSTMDTEIYKEILTFDLATFIGTAGGSLGLFIGFSFTGFIWQVLDFFMRD